MDRDRRLRSKGRRLSAAACAPLLLAGTLTGFFAVSLTPLSAGADGTTLYASPTGSGGDCTSDAPCSLPEALSSAADGSTIDLAAGNYQTTGGSSFTIGASITVQPSVPGSSVDLVGSSVPPESSGWPVVVVNTGATVTISGVTIEGGIHRGYTGGIYNGGALTLVDSTVADNNVSVSNGGITSDGSLTLIGSTVSHNSASIAAGAIDASGNLTIYDSTVSDNGSNLQYCTVCAGTGPITIDDSTLAGTGWIEATGPMKVESSTLVHTTLSAEPLSLAGDVLAEAAGVLAAPSGLTTADCRATQGSSVVDDGYNIDDDGSCGLSAANNSVSDSSVIDDYLGTLSANGGPTETIPLLSTPSPSTSTPDPALSAIPSTFNLPVAVNGQSLDCSQPDQRGTTRGQPCDVGAFEGTAEPPAAAPEIAAPVLFPVAALVLGGVGYGVYKRRRNAAVRA